MKTIKHIDEEIMAEETIEKVYHKRNDTMRRKKNYLMENSRTLISFFSLQVK